MTQQTYEALCARTTCTTPQSLHTLVTEAGHGNPATTCEAFVIPVVPDCARAVCQQTSPEKHGIEPPHVSEDGTCSGYVHPGSTTYEGGGGRFGGGGASGTW